MASEIALDAPAGSAAPTSSMGLPTILLDARRGSGFPAIVPRLATPGGRPPLSLARSRASPEVQMRPARPRRPARRRACGHAKPASGDLASEFARTRAVLRGARSFLRRPRRGPEAGSSARFGMSARLPAANPAGVGSTRSCRAFSIQCDLGFRGAISRRRYHGRTASLRWRPRCVGDAYTALLKVLNHPNGALTAASRDACGVA